jgi:hypothetical protein
MRTGTPSQRLAAALAVHPRPQTVAATAPPDAVDPHGFGVLHVHVAADGSGARPMTTAEIAALDHE